MGSNKFWFFVLTILTAFFLQSCSEEENETLEIAPSETFTSTDTIINSLAALAITPPDGVEDADNLRNHIVQNWTDLLLELDRYATGMRPNASARAFAYIYLTAYEACVPGMRNLNSNSNRLRGLNVREPQNRQIQWELAMNSAISGAIDHFIINLPQEQRIKIRQLERQNEDFLTRNLNRDVAQRSKNWGRTVTRTVIEYSRTDRSAERQITDPQPDSYEPPTGDGFWTYSAEPERALFPYWGRTRTFVISPDETTTVAPIEYSTDSGSDYYGEMKEVYDVNNEAKETQGEQLHIAEFWSDDVEGLMMSPPGRQLSILNQLIASYDVNLEESLGLFLKLGFALNDAAVSAWKYKYQHMVMRPSNYIHEFIDPEFQTNLYRLVFWPNPSFPGYPSGHSTFASAAAGIFIDYFGDQVNFTDNTHEGRTEFLGEPRTFSSLSEMAEENAFSRIPLGVHVRMDCVEGYRLGYEISDAVNQLDLNVEQ